VTARGQTGHFGGLQIRSCAEMPLSPRFATRAYRGSRNLRAVQSLLGHVSILTTERYTALEDDEIRAAAACAW
jgi:site-specific recombinase XerC